MANTKGGCGGCNKPKLSKMSSLDSYTLSRSKQNEEDIIEQLEHFGYSQQEISSAMKLTEASDINEIVESIQRQQSIGYESEWNEMLQCMDSMSATKQYRIVSKLKNIGDKLLNQEYSKYDRLYLDKSKLIHSVLSIEIGLEFLSKMGFEAHPSSQSKLVCKKVEVPVIRACIECLEQKLKMLTMASPNMSPSKLSPNTSRGSLSCFDDEEDEEEDEEKEEKSEQTPRVPMEHQLLWEEYVSLHGKPLRAEQFMFWAKQNGKSMKFVDAKKLMEENGHFVLDMMASTNKKTESMSMTGATKQFYKFLKRHGLEAHFNAFKDHKCCDIGDIEYLVDEQFEDFLKNELEIHTVIDRKKLMVESRKLKESMLRFEAECIQMLKLKESTRNKLRRFGIVTRDILRREVQQKHDLLIKFGINEQEQQEALWSLIEDGKEHHVSVDHHYHHHHEDAEDDEEGTEMEGMQNVAVNVVDTMHGHHPQDGVAVTGYI